MYSWRQEGYDITTNVGSLFGVKRQPGDVFIKQLTFLVQPQFIYKHLPGQILLWCLIFNIKLLLKEKKQNFIILIQYCLTATYTKEDGAVL